MSMPDEPTLGELGRRIDAQADASRAGFEAINKRLDVMPTNELMLAHMATWETRIKNAEDDIAEIKSRTQQARAIAISTAIGAAGVVVALIGVLQGGAPG